MELGYNFSALKGQSLAERRAMKFSHTLKWGDEKVSNLRVLINHRYIDIYKAHGKSQYIIWGIFSKHKDHGSNRWAFCITVFHSMIRWLGSPAPIPGTLKARGKT